MLAAEGGGSTGAFRMGAVAEECFEGFLTGVLVQEAFPFLRIHLGGVELVASFT